MFPSRDLSAIAKDNNNVSNESTNTNKTDEKRKSLVG
jgi:hypothetical protein